MNRLRYVLAALALLAALGAYAGTQAGGTDAAVTAPVWVATSGAGCPDACSTFQAAFSVAAPGSTIGVRDGSYPAQTVTGAAKSQAVTFQAENAGQAKVAGLTVNTDRTHFVGIIASGTGEARGTLTVCGTACPTKFTDILFDGFAGKSAFIRASGVTVQNSEFGNADGCKNVGTEDAFRFWGGSGSETPENDKLIGSYIHDWAGGSNGTCDGKISPTPHLDCMQNQGGANMEIRGNVFAGCPSDNIQMEPFSGATISNVTVSGNYLGQTSCCNAIVLGTPDVNVTAATCSTLAITGNTMFSSPNLDKCANKGVVVSGNTMCSSATQAGCAIPAWPSGTTPPPPPPPTTTTAPPPPPPAYHPACEPSCDQQIADAGARIAALNASLADTTQALDTEKALVAHVHDETAP